MPTSQTSVPTTNAIAELVAIVLSQGCHPACISPTGKRCRRKNRYAGATPNITSG
jgi:hypothetical protein